MHPLKAAAQAGVAKGPVATAVAGQLVHHATYVGYLLVDVDLPALRTRLLESRDRIAATAGIPTTDPALGETLIVENRPGQGGSTARGTWEEANRGTGLGGTGLDP